jgi:pimeloyl-ACP methyl ester carboxylesterase
MSATEPGRGNPGEQEEQGGGTPQREALIYLPGLGARESSRMAAQAERIRHALNRYADPGAARFEPGPADAILFGDGRMAHRSSILRKDQGEVTARLDLIEVDWMGGLLGRYRKRKALWRFVSVGLLLLTHTTGCFRWAMSQLFSAKGSSGRQALQIVMPLMGFGALAFYFVSLTVAVVLGLLQLLDVVDLTGWGPIEQKAGEEVLTGFAKVILGVEFVRLIPLRKVQDHLSEWAERLAAAIEYLDGVAGSESVTSHIPNLLDQLADEEEPYRRIHVMGYSMGSVVALDSLFPGAGRSCPRLEDVSSVTTIGLPTGMLGALGQQARSWDRESEQELKWLDVLIPDDAVTLGRAQGHRPQLAKATHELVQYRRERRAAGMLWRAVALGGLQLHSHYWDETDAAARCCFDGIVQQLFGECALLASDLDPDDQAGSSPKSGAAPGEA